jgi:hypothetical protein
MGKARKKRMRKRGIFFPEEDSVFGVRHGVSINFVL